MRAAWLRGRPAAGAALVVRQGLLAWLRALSAEPEAAAPVLDPTAEAADPGPVPVAGDELVAALVNLLLNRRQERTP
jgi:hypothetical protein